MFFLVILAIYTIATYGLSWLLTQSYLFDPFRDRIRMWSDTTESRLFKPLLQKLEYLSNCIVCTSVWVGLTLAALAPTSRALDYGNAMCITSITDAIVWMGWSAAMTWMLANLLGDTE